MKLKAPLFTAALLFTTLVAAPAALAQKFPDKPLTLYVGFPAGGSADTVARALATEMSKQLGQPVTVNNKVGASGNTATQTVLDEPADGYSLLFAAIHLATNPSLGDVKYNPEKDLQMVSQVTSVPVVMLASTASGLQNVNEVAAASRKSATGLRVGSGGAGTSSHLAQELFKRAMGVQLVHVPYKGGAPANDGLVAGQVDLMFDLMSSNLKALIDAGKVKPLTVMQNRPISALPNVKSAGELRLPPAAYIRSWQGIAVKSGTPPQVASRLHEAVLAAASTKDFRARIQALGSEVTVSAKSDEFQAHYQRELTRWSTLIKAANIVTE
ncbi:MAG: tripartite tricarboxylate transporter substrate binding protein [Polaromonas sp.]|nr:tripartite tricarboxylate transporter substrate binding protein [Polaromonas sp.]